MTNLPENPEHTTPIKVYYFDTDAGGVVHNVAYLRMIEIARTEFAEYLGWSLQEMKSTQLVPVVYRTEIDYLKPARLGDSLEITSRLTAIKKVRFHLEFDILLSPDSTPIARCKQIMVPVQLPQGRPRPSPKIWTEAYPHLLDA